MLMPSIFGENLFNDDWMDFGFPEIDKALYGKHAGHVMKTDVKETDAGYEVDIDLPGFKKDEINAKLENASEQKRFTGLKDRICEIMQNMQEN